MLHNGVFREEAGELLESRAVMAIAEGGGERTGQDGGFYSQPVTFMGTAGTRVVAAESIGKEDGIATIKSHQSACKLQVY